MAKVDPQATEHMVDMAKWLQNAIASGQVSALSLVIVDESGDIPTPRHAFFATPSGLAPLLGGYTVAMHDIVSHVGTQLMPRPPSVPAGTRIDPITDEDNQQSRFEFEEVAPPGTKPN